MTDTKILIVDDDNNISDLLKIYLENEGYNVKIAGDGVEGLNFFKMFEMNTQLRKFQIKICINYINKLLKSKNFSTMFVCETRNKEAHEYESVQNGRN